MELLNKAFSSWVSSLTPEMDENVQGLAICWHQIYIFIGRFSVIWAGRHKDSLACQNVGVLPKASLHGQPMESYRGTDPFAVHEHGQAYC